MPKAIVEAPGEPVLVKFIDHDAWGTHQGFENVTEYPFEVGQEVEVEHTDDVNPMITKVFVDGRLVVDLPGEYIKLKHEAYQIENKLELYRRYLKNKFNYAERMAALHPALRERLEGIIGNHGEEFYTEPMGFEYELFISEQATLLIESFKDPAIRQGVKDARALIPDDPDAPSYQWETGTIYWDNDSPLEALIAWYALNSQLNDYRYKDQVALVPGWSDDHSGMTASTAFAFAKWLTPEH